MEHIVFPTAGDDYVAGLTHLPSLELYILKLYITQLESNVNKPSFVEQF